MKLFDLLKGKKVKVMTNMKVPVILEIAEVKEVHHSVETGPSNASNDWWPTTEDWTTYTVKFTNGAEEEYRNLDAIELINE